MNAMRDDDAALFYMVAGYREYWKFRALAAIGEAKLQECADDPDAVAKLFRTAIVVGSGPKYNKTLKTLTEICNHAKQDAEWCFEQPDPAIGEDG